MANSLFKIFFVLLMKESNFYQEIYSYFNLYKKKRFLKFLIPVFLGVLYKLNAIALFIIPIQAIKAVSEKKFSITIKSIFEFFRLNVPNDQNAYIFFLIFIIFSLLILIFINIIKNFYIQKIKKEFHSLHYAPNNITKFDSLNKKQINKKLDNFIKNSENIFFCLTLFTFIFFYDYQISLIIIFGSFIYIYITNINDIDYIMVNGTKKQTNNSFHKKFSTFLKKVNIDSKILKPLVSTIIMILIMTLVYVRTNSSISIIFIFLIRLFQNNMLNSLKKFSKRDKLLF